MKQNTKIKSFIFAAAVSLGVAMTASAQTASATAPAPSQPEPAAGLLGSRYTGVAYDYLDLSGTGPNHAQGLDLTFNQPLAANFDLNLGYDWARANYAGARYTQQDFEVGSTAYTNLNWGKPFALAAAGWDWARGGGAHDDSFFYKVGVGVEFPVAGSFSVSPFVNFERATGFNENEFDFGVKAEYRVTREWGVAARVQYDSIQHASDQTEYTLGVNYHF